MNPIIFRKIISPLWQKFKKQRINYYLRLLIKNQFLSRNQIDRNIFRELKKLLFFCEKNVPYYRKLFSEMDIRVNDIKNFKDFSNLPILTKEVFRKNYKDFIPDKNFNSEYGYTETSGSTGAPTKFMISKTATEKWYAAKLYGRILHGVMPGDPILWIWGRKFKKNHPFYEFLKNNLENEYKFSAFDIDENKAIELVKLIKRKKIKSIYGYSSAIYEFSKILKKKNLAVNLSKIFITAEAIYDYQQEMIESVFNCSVVKEYGAAEMGIITFDCKKGKSHIIEDNVYVELKKNDDDSKLNEIIITDLNNYAMPLLRYNSGDLSSGFIKEQCSCGSVKKILKNVVGRKYDMIKLSNGKVIHGELVNYILKHALLDQFPNGCLFQFEQETFVDFKLSLGLFNLDLNTQDVIYEKIRQSLNEALGLNYKFNLSVLFNEKIVRPNSGKHRYIISNI